MRFFAKENINNEELQKALERMEKQIEIVNRQFTFDLKIDDEGWIARCREFDGIVTGGTNKNPSEKEIMQSLIDTIKTAFHIPISKLKIESEELQKFPTIQVVREFQFAGL